ncbi:MAG TPA: GDP-L-fucose synthase [Bryobacteraceae bacterium]|jgi:GDP-L-fucose synthase|nr:GDP-L-fucose synthase [Bryobacteraceae bacterium]
MDRSARIYVAGHRGMVGSAIVRRLEEDGYTSLLRRSHAELDLTRQEAVEKFFAAERPEYVFDAAARVGGILANSSYPADFIGVNLTIQTNLIHTAWKSGVKKFLFLGSSCIYPKFAAQPMREDALLTGELEPTNQWYAIAKIAGIKMIEAYRQQYGFPGISLMPTNLYGPGDNFDPQTSHVVPALIRRFHEACLSNAPEVVLWGTGTPKREFLHVDDLASAALHAMSHYDEAQFLNAGTGEDVTIAQLAELLRGISGYQGRIVYDASKPDGTPRKLLDVSRIHALGWRHKIGLRDGLESAYRWYVEHAAGAR